MVKVVDSWANKKATEDEKQLRNDERVKEEALELIRNCPCAFFGVTGDKVKFWEDNDYSLLDLELEEVQHFCDTVVLARDVLVKYPGFDGDMMLAKLGVLDVFNND